MGTAFAGVGITRPAARLAGLGGLGDVFEAWCAGHKAADGIGVPAGSPDKTRPDFLEMARRVLRELTGENSPTMGGESETHVPDAPPIPSAALWEKLIVATTKGDMTGGPAPLGKTLQRLTNGPAYVVSTACTSGLVAMIEAAMWVHDGEAERVAAMGADVAGDFVRNGFTALKAISPTLCRPFDRRRDGLMLGSAAAGCVIERASQEPLAVISGWGVSNDATHMTAPDRDARGLVRAIEAALMHARLEPAEIDVVFAHGTGTKYNDAMEAVAILRVFSERRLRPMVTGVKGLIGHTLGAAGLVEAMLAVEMLRRQVVPGVVGLEEPEWEGIDFVMEPRAAPVQHVLKIGSGFGGMNAAVILSRRGSHAE